MAHRIIEGTTPVPAMVIAYLRDPVLGTDSGWGNRSQPANNSYITAATYLNPMWQAGDGNGHHDTISYDIGQNCRLATLLPDVESHDIQGLRFKVWLRDKFDEACTAPGGHLSKPVEPRRSFLSCILASQFCPAFRSGKYHLQK